MAIRTQFIFLVILACMAYNAVAEKLEFLENYFENLQRNLDVMDEWYNGMNHDDEQRPYYDDPRKFGIPHRNLKGSHLFLQEQALACMVCDNRTPVCRYLDRSFDKLARNIAFMNRRINKRNRKGRHNDPYTLNSRRESGTTLAKDHRSCLNRYYATTGKNAKTVRTPTFEPRIGHHRHSHIHLHRRPSPKSRHLLKHGHNKKTPLHKSVTIQLQNR